MNVVRLGPEYFPLAAEGRPVSNGSIYVGIADLDPEIVANQKQLSVRQEDGTVVQVSQPISTGAGGVPLYNGSPVTLLVDGEYSIKVKDSEDVQIYYMPTNSGSTTLFLSESACDLAAVVTAIGAVTPTTIVVDCDAVIAEGVTVTITENIVLDVIKGGTIDGTSGGGAETLAFTNSRPIAGTYQIFGDDLTVTGLSFAYPEWWGYSSSASGTNNRTYFNKALQALASGGSIYVSPYAATVDITAGGFQFPAGQITVYGEGEPSRMNIVNPGLNDVFDTLDYDGNRFKNFRISGDSSGTSSAIRFGINSWRNFVDGMFIENCSENGVIIDGWNTTVKDTYIAGCGQDGVNVDKDRLGANTGFCVEIDVIDCYIVNCGRHGIYFNKCASHRAERNEIGGNTQHGISNVGNNKGFVCNGNHSEDNSGDGIFCQVSSSPTIIGNRCFGIVPNQQYGIHISTCTGGTVLSNRTLNNAVAGIRIISHSTPPVLLAGNSEDETIDAGVPDAALLDLSSISINDGLMLGNIQGDLSNSVYNSAISVTKTVADGTTVDFMTFQATGANFAGIVSIAARAVSEESTHVYAVTSDQSGAVVFELGTGSNRNGTILLTAAISGGDTITLTADATTGLAWAASPSVTIKADITSGNTITTTKL